jgi:predicted transcriptional regulator
MDDLILMICKTHQGEWLTAQRVRDIVSAIKGKRIMLTPVKKAMARLAKKDKLTRMQHPTEGEQYTAIEKTKGGFYL